MAPASESAVARGHLAVDELMSLKERKMIAFQTLVEKVRAAEEEDSQKVKDWLQEAKDWMRDVNGIRT